MHGLMHVVLKDWVVTAASADKWAEVLQEWGHPEEALLSLVQQKDEITVAGVTAAAEVLGVAFGEVLRAYGGHFVRYIHQSGHQRMLLSMGSTLPSFLRNINHLHFNMQADFAEANFPFFKVENDETTPSVFRFSYSSAREFLAPLCEGVLCELGAVLFKQHLTMERLEEPLPGFNASWSCVTTNMTPQEHHQRTGSCDLRLSLTTLHSALASLAIKQSIPASPTVRDVRERYAALDALYTSASSPAEASRALLHSVRAGDVASEWTDADALTRTGAFWSASSGEPKDFFLSSQSKSISRFVSHSWSQPAGWSKIMGPTCSYAELKATELAASAKAIVATDGARAAWGDVTLWVDKACIPQQHPYLVPVCISMLEDFIQRCDGVLVLPSWEYFSRLWCVYEWCCMLRDKSPGDITLSVDAFLRPSTLPLYIEAIERFSVADAQVSVESDRAVLAAKIDKYYTSAAAFESYLKCTATALMAMNAMRRAGLRAGLAAFDDEVRPWFALAERLGFADLHAALHSAQPDEWRRASAGADHGGGSSAETMPKSSIGVQSRLWMAEYLRLVRGWFDRAVKPLLDAMRKRVLR